MNQNLRRNMVMAVHPTEGTRFYCLPCAWARCSVKQHEMLVAGGSAVVKVGEVQETWVLTTSIHPCARCHQ